MKPVKFLLGVLVALMLVSCGQKKDISDAQITAIAKEAYIYGYPMVANYKKMFDSAIDTQDPGFKKPFNEFYMQSQVDTHADQARETVTNDIQIGSVWFDLRREPLVMTVPAIGEERYFSVQFTDMFGYNFNNVGTRKGNSAGGQFLVTGPGWKGATPAGIDRVIQSETQFVLGLVRIQLHNLADRPVVREIQSRFAIQPLSAYSGTVAPTDVAYVEFPVYDDDMLKSPAFFEVMSFLMQFAPAPQEEAELLKRFASIGIAPGSGFSMESMSETEKNVFQAGIDGARADLEGVRKAGIITAAEMFGMRTDLKGNHLNRAFGTLVDPVGATPREITTITLSHDSDFRALHGSDSYTIRFEKDATPPVNAFWSLTMYRATDQRLVANPINRYFVNSSMLPDMQVDAEDGSLTIYIQKEAPVAPPATEEAVAPQDLQANWLPAPEGDFYMVMRLYLPAPEALDGTWKEPVVVRSDTGTVSAEATGEAAPAEAAAPSAPEAAAQEPAVKTEAQEGVAAKAQEAETKKAEDAGAQAAGTQAAGAQAAGAQVAGAQVAGTQAADAQAAGAQAAGTQAAGAETATGQTAATDAEKAPSSPAAPQQ